MDGARLRSIAWKYLCRPLLGSLFAPYIGLWLQSSSSSSNMNAIAYDRRIITMTPRTSSPLCIMNASSLLSHRNHYYHHQHGRIHIIHQDVYKGFLFFTS
eukprot:TRINITY_DN34712_c0_g1_i1.p1 TRINITY_DN34712_c0_g1~~TRINITY_DN34712_c0_g1_i1.p1  ORF type:complete len:100 (-),score=6.44 TRINITY_DN34712_c0_g1_i1:11-310(-)